MTVGVGDAMQVGHAVACRVGAPQKRSADSTTKTTATKPAIAPIIWIILTPKAVSFWYATTKSLCAIVAKISVSGPSPPFVSFCLPQDVPASYPISTRSASTSANNYRDNVA